VNRFDVENTQSDLPRSYLVVGESAADVAFVEALLIHRGIRDRYHLGFPEGRRTGKYGFGDYLIGLRTKLERPSSQVQKVLIVTDSDEDHGAAFTIVRDQIRAANAELKLDRNYPIPTAVRVTANGFPSVGIVTLPFDEQGCLETVLVAAADDGTHPLHDCFEAYWACTHFDHNRRNVESKQKLTTIIAASNPNNPSCSLVFIWSDDQRRWNPMRPDHPVFQPFSDFLVNFAT